MIVFLMSILWEMLQEYGVLGLLLQPNWSQDTHRTTAVVFSALNQVRSMRGVRLRQHFGDISAIGRRCWPHRTVTFGVHKKGLRPRMMQLERESACPSLWPCELV